MTTEGPLPTRRTKLEVAEIFRAHGPDYRERHSLSPEQREVMAAIEACRTQVLGGQAEVCDRCGHVEVSYNSCRNRHCPKCQALDQARWIAEREKRVLPTHHFHVVFTLPQQLRPLAARNREMVFDQLFKAASATLLQMGKDPAWLGGMLGITAILHTWTRELHFHPHLHCIVTGGALSADGQSWLPTKQQFLFPVRVLSSLFRGKFLSALRSLYRRGLLDLHGRCARLEDQETFSAFVDQLAQTEWVVYAKPTLAGPEQTIRYLGRYTHRVGLSNERLVAFEDGQVTFATKHGKRTTISAESFIRRFLLHVLPKKYVKIRHYGLLSAAHATTSPEKARTLLEQSQQSPEGASPIEADPCEELSWRELMRLLTGDDLSLCPHCGQGKMVPVPLDAVFGVLDLSNEDTSCPGALTTTRALPSRRRRQCRSSSIHRFSAAALETSTQQECLCS